jgi:hypothetical protein
MQANEDHTLSAAAPSVTRMAAATPTRVQTAVAEWSRGMNHANDRNTCDAQGRIFSEIAEGALEILGRTPSKDLSDILLKLWTFNYESYQNGGPLLDSIVAESSNEGGPCRQGRTGPKPAPRTPRTRHEPSAVQGRRREVSRGPGQRSRLPCSAPPG